MQLWKMLEVHGDQEKLSMYDIRKEWEHDIFTSRTSSKKITAFFKNGQSVTYTMNIYDMLITDKQIDFICDSETGEVIFSRE